MTGAPTPGELHRPASHGPHRSEQHRSELHDPDSYSPDRHGGHPAFDDLLTGEAVALDLRPAGFVLRAAGAAIDLVVLALLLIGAAFAVSNPVFELDPSATQALILGLVILITIGVPTAVETATAGRSLGRWATGTRIVRDDGGAIGLRHALVRSLTGFLELVMTLGGLAALVGLLNARSKRLGDLLAGTYSRYERVRAIRRPVLDLPPGLEQWSATADVARLPDRLARRISRFLAQADGLRPDMRARIADELAVEAAPFVAPVPPIPAEALLRAVAVLRRTRESTALRLEREREQQLEPVLTALPHGFPDRG